MWLRRRRKCRTDGSLADEVNDRENFTGVGIDKSLVPGGLLLILDLNDVSQSGGAILEIEVLELGFPFVVGTVESLLGVGNGSLNRDGGLGVGDLGCERFLSGS